MDKQKYLMQIDRFYNKRLETFRLIELGKTPDALINAGAKQLPMIMKQSNLRKCIREPRGSRSAHQIERSFIEQLPEQLETPVLIVRDTTRNSLVLINEYQDKNGYHMLLAVQKEQRINEKLVNEIKSIYGKEHLKEYLQKEEVKNNLIIADNKKVKEMFRVIGLQLPEALTNLDYINNIPPSFRNVNLENIKNQGKSSFVLGKEKIIKDIRLHGYEPTRSLVDNMQKLYGMTKACRNLKDIHTLHQDMDAINNPDIKETLDQIAQECREQELERMQLPPPQV